MKAKRKLLISVLVMLFVLLAAVGTIAVIFALSQQNVTTSLDIGYTTIDIDGSVNAWYAMNDGDRTPLVAMQGETVLGDTLKFDAEDSEETESRYFKFPDVEFTSPRDYITICYTYSNTGDRHYIATMEEVIANDNMKVEYGIWDYINEEIKYSEDRYAVVVPANSSNKSYWVKISIDNKAKNASYNGSFQWVLDGCDDVPEAAYKSLEAVDFIANGDTGTYSAYFKGNVDALDNGKLTFPDNVNGNPVTTIVDNNNLSDEVDGPKWQVTSVYIPDSVTTIGEYAFGGYENLTAVTFEQNETAGSASVQSDYSLLEIGKKAFQSTTMLYQIEIPNTVTTIGDYAFDFSGLEEIIIPDSVTYLGEFAFAETYNFSSVTLGKGLTTIKTGTFQTYSYSLNEVIIPDNITTIEANAFAECCIMDLTLGKGLTNLVSNSFGSYAIGAPYSDPLSSTSITFRNANIFSFFKNVDDELNVTIEEVTELPGSTFSGWTNLQSVVLADGVAEIKSQAFYNCTNLISVELPNSLTRLYGSVFSGCSNLQQIELPASLTRIDNYVFKGCAMLENITIPAAVTKIGTNAFNGCGLESITFENTTGWILADTASATTGTSVDVTSANTELAAWITSNYASKYWNRV